MINIETVDYGDHEEVIGSVNHREVISLKRIDGQWSVSSAVTLPWNLSEAQDVIKCFDKACRQTQIVEM